jgi:hypothetical protein
MSASHPLSSNAAWSRHVCTFWKVWRVTTLHEVAHARAGDKGDISDISVIAFDAADYPLLREQLTVERVREHFSGIALGAVTRYELPALGALKFVLEHALGGGVTRSLGLDPHGKSLGQILLELELPPTAEQRNAPNV